MIVLSGVSKFYFENKKSVTGLNNICLSLPQKGLITLLGESGSGKSTLLNILSLNDICSEGNYYFDGIDVDTFGEKETQNFKTNIVSVIKQELNLIPSFTVKENLQISSELVLDSKKSKEKIREVLDRLDILDLINKKVENLSGGQKQKVAVARALISSPKFIIADEPTGSLDSENARTIANILKEISEDILVIVATHDKELFNPISDKIIEIKNGVIKSTIKSSKEDVNNETVDLLKTNHSSKVFNPVKVSKLSFRTFLLSFISMFITLFLYSASLSSMKNSSQSYSPTYLNFQEDRYIVTRIDGKEFSDEDYEFFGKKEGFKCFCKYDELLDTEFEISSINSNDVVDTLIRPVELLKKVDSGILPQLPEESVITVVGRADNLIPQRYRYLISLDGESKEEIINVGYTQFKDDAFSPSIRYVTSYIFGKLYINYAIKTFRNYISDSERTYDNFKIILNDEIGSDYIYSNSIDLFDKRITFNIETLLGKTISQNNIMCKNIKEVLPNYNNDDEFVIAMSTKIYNNILNSKTYQMSVFSSNKIFSDDKYSVLYPNEYTKINVSDNTVALGYFYMILTIGLGFGVSLLSYLFIKNSFKYELEKLVVFESLGYSSKQIKKYICYKALIPTAISYLLIIGLFLYFDYLSTLRIDTISFIFTGSIPVIQILIIPFVFMMILFMIIIKKLYNLYQNFYEGKYGKACD